MKKYLSYKYFYRNSNTEGMVETDTQPVWLLDLGEIQQRFAREGLSPAVIEAFQAIIWEYYRREGRVFPWRQTTDPYRIMLSEIMLQQTQASRVVEKYDLFLRQFPTPKSLADAPISQLLAAWQGLGYNRRALNLQRAVQQIQNERAGQFPQTSNQWVELPGIGPYTAAAILAFAFNQPTVVIETNIRRVYIKAFFAENEVVHDRQILPLIAATLPEDDARVWYWALMDIGHILPKLVGNPNRQSRHYLQQSKFEGSHRQVRGQILKYLLDHGRQPVTELRDYLQVESSALQATLQELEREGFLVVEDSLADLLH